MPDLKTVLQAWRRSVMGGWVLAVLAPTLAACLRQLRPILRDRADGRLARRVFDHTRSMESVAALADLRRVDPAFASVLQRSSDSAKDEAKPPP